jgi:hypothetical protein
MLTFYSMDLKSNVTLQFYLIGDVESAPQAKTLNRETAGADRSSADISEAPQCDSPQQGELKSSKFS